MIMILIKEKIKMKLDVYVMSFLNINMKKKILIC